MAKIKTRDGDEMLIELVKQRSDLWNKDITGNKDSELKNILWEEISAQMNIEKKWLRRRWFTLRERFGKYLKWNLDIKNGVTLVNAKPFKFRYYDQMMFIKQFIQFRDRPEYICGESTIVQQTHTSTNNIENVLIDPLHLKLPENNDNEKIEFSIKSEELSNTEEEIDPNQIFIELPSEEVEALKNDHKNLADEYKRTLGTLVGIDASQLIKSDNEKCSCSDVMHKYLNEDRAFGDLVTAMLIKLDETNKRKAKRQIINYLLK